MLGSKSKSLQGRVEAFIITMGLLFIPHTGVPYSELFQSPVRSVVWIAEIGFPLQMGKKAILFFLIFKKILEAIAKDSENEV